MTRTMRTKRMRKRSCLGPPTLSLQKDREPRLRPYTYHHGLVLWRASTNAMGPSVGQMQYLSALLTYVLYW